MAALDVILNLATVLLWFNWRSMRAESFSRFPAATLIGTLKRTTPHSWRAWRLLPALIALLTARGLLYYYLGAPAGWIARLNLGPVVLAFRTDSVLSALAYSLLSFGRALAVAYLWIVAVVTVTRGMTDPDPIQRVLRLQVGRTLRWPPLLAGSLPFFGVTVVWLALHPALAALNVVTRTSVAHLLEQAMLLNLALACTLEFLVVPLLLLHFITSYVYLGSNPFWEFVANTAQRFLAPLKPLPLRMGKLDFTALAGVALVVCLLHWAPWFIQDTLAQHNLTLWPE